MFTNSRSQVYYVFAWSLTNSEFCARYLHVLRNIKYKQTGATSSTQLDTRCRCDSVKCGAESDNSAPYERQQPGEQLSQDRHTLNHPDLTGKKKGMYETCVVERQFMQYSYQRRGQHETEPEDFVSVFQPASR